MESRKNLSCVVSLLRMYRLSFTVKFKSIIKLVHFNNKHVVIFVVASTGHIGMSAVRGIITMRGLPSLLLQLPYCSATALG